MSAEVDYLIVGQGLAGSLLGYLLAEEGRRILIIDKEQNKTASKVAAGLLNPITGKRFVKGPDTDEAVTFAHAFYPLLEKKLGVSFFEPIPIVRLLKEGEVSMVKERLQEDGYKKYLTSIQKPNTRSLFAVDSYGSVNITQGALVHLKPLLAALREYFLNKGMLKNEVFDYGKLKVVGNGVQYGDMQAKECIFCEGVGVRENPFFRELPFEYAKGEILTIKFAEAFLEKQVLVKDYALVPVGGGIYRLGATYDWSHIDFEFSKAGEEALIKGLEEMVTVKDFEILERQVGVRVNGKNRLPVVARHSQYPSLRIVNGFGSKGVLNIPLQVKKLVEELKSVRF